MEEIGILHISVNGARKCIHKQLVGRNKDTRWAL